MIGYEVAINDQSPVVVTSPDVAVVIDRKSTRLNSSHSH